MCISSRPPYHRRPSRNTDEKPLGPNPSKNTNNDNITNKNNSRRIKRIAALRAGADAAVGVLSFFPVRARCTLPYTDEISVSTTALSSSFGTETSYRLNSLFDPYFSAGGHQPYGFDQMCTFYNRYMVDKVDIEVTFSDPTADGLVVGCYYKNYNDTYQLQTSTISQADERPTNWVKNLNDSGTQVATFRKSLSLPALMGLTQTQYESGWPSLSALISADPAITPYFSIAVADARSSSSTQTVRCKIRLVYHGIFWERRTVAQS